MQDGILFDNILIADDEKVATSILERTWKTKYEVEKEKENAEAAVAGGTDGLSEFQKKIFDVLYKITDIPFLEPYKTKIIDVIEKGEKQPNITIGVLVSIIVVFVTVLCRILFGSKKPTVPVKPATEVKKPKAPEADAPPMTQFHCRTDRSGLIGGAPRIRVPYPFQWGALTFDAGEAFAMMAASFVAVVESTGAFIAVSRYVSATPLSPSVLSRGVGWQGIGIFLDGLFGTGNESSVSIENSRLLVLTRVGSRRVVQISAGFMIFFSILGKFGAVFASIPSPIFAVKQIMQSNATSPVKHEKLSNAELHRATDGFSAANLLGVGSFGFVYTGVLGSEELEVAIKVLNLLQHGAEQSFLAECEPLRSIRHRNLVKVITACSTMDRSGHNFRAFMIGRDPMSQAEIDNFMIQQLDGTKNEWGWCKQELGANAILAVSLAVCKAEHRSSKVQSKYPPQRMNGSDEAGDENAEFSSVCWDVILTVTNNFSEYNMLGKGGFESVYKGVLEGGVEVAVNRLSEGSGQGVEEFRSEVVLVAKLQHRNTAKWFLRASQLSRNFQDEANVRSRCEL
ncbi:hypothetical protein ABZP36_015204 [Zizania latifolia]